MATMTFLSALISVNILSFISMALDKHYAVRNKWRISEAFLLSLACLCGSVGTLLGMVVFRHKTRKARFRFGVPVIVALQWVGGLWLSYLDVLSVSVHLGL